MGNTNPTKNSGALWRVSISCFNLGICCVTLVKVVSLKIYVSDNNSFTVVSQVDIFFHMCSEYSLFLRKLLVLHSSNLFYLIIKLIKYFFFVFLEKDAESVVKLTDELYALLLKENLLGKNCKRRSAILKSIFKILDLDDPRVLLRLARLILSVSK